MENCYLLIFVIINYQHVGATKIMMSFYTYGNYTEGAQVSYYYHGSLPVFTPYYCMTIKPFQEFETLLDPTFTFVKVAYFNRLSTVNVEFNPLTSELCFSSKFPFIETPIGIWGYSLPHAIQKQ